MKLDAQEKQLNGYQNPIKSACNGNNGVTERKNVEQYHNRSIELYNRKEGNERAHSQTLLDTNFLLHPSRCVASNLLISRSHHLQETAGNI